MKYSHGGGFKTAGNRNSVYMVDSDFLCLNCGHPHHAPGGKCREVFVNSADASITYSCACESCKCTNCIRVQELNTER